MIDRDSSLITPHHNPLILGIETSCDETAVALVRRRPDGSADILADVIYSQIEDHQAYGGVVPEIAARSHIEHLDGLIRQTVAEAKLEFTDLDAVAATTGPGLVGGLMVGALEAKALATVLEIPFVSINHLAAHALSPRLTKTADEMPQFPYLLLLVSGGHCQILAVHSPDKFTRLGTTIDDAAGEAFDKIAKIMNLGYPGGPAIEKLAAAGRSDRFRLPRPLLSRKGYDFSFSGLKTAVRRQAHLLAQHQLKSGVLTQLDAADLAASFQRAVSDCLAGQVRKVLKDSASEDLNPFHGVHQNPKSENPPKFTALVVAGGVAANQVIRRDLQRVSKDYDLDFVAPPLRYCTDNAVMIAWAAAERLALNPDIDEKEVQIRARWPLDAQAVHKIGSGRKGSKA